MDEVFDLKKKNMWFRSQFVSILKGFLRAFMGDSLNRYEEKNTEFYLIVHLIFIVKDAIILLRNEEKKTYF